MWFSIPLNAIPGYYYIVFNEKSVVAKQLRSFHFKNHKYVSLIRQTELLPCEAEL